MRIHTPLMWYFAHLAACASFAGKQDGYAAFIAESGRGDIFGHAMRDLTKANPGRAVQDTGIGAGKFWQHDPATGNVEDVSHLVANLGAEDTARLEHHQELWAEEEANIPLPKLSAEEESEARRVMNEWEKNPKSLRRRSTALKVAGTEMTEEKYHALKAELRAEFGEIEGGEETTTAAAAPAVAGRDVNSAQFFDPFSLFLFTTLLPALVIGGVVLGGLAIAGGVAGAIVGGISAGKKHRKKKRKAKEDKEAHPNESKEDRKERHRQEKEDKKEKHRQEKEEKKEGKKKGPPGRRAKRTAVGVTDWRAGGKAIPIISIAEMEDAAEAALAV